MRIITWTVFQLLVFSLFSQQKITFGFGQTIDSYTLNGASFVSVTDSILFANTESFANPLNGQIRNDPRLILFAKYQLKQKRNFNLSIGVQYSRQWTRIDLGRIVDDPQSILPIRYYQPIVARNTFYLPVNLIFTPFLEWPIFSKIRPLRAIEVGVGIGPSFHFGNTTSRIDDYPLNLRNDREDPLYYEMYYQFGTEAFKVISLNYNFSVAAPIYKSFGIELMSTGSLGDVTRPFTVFDQSYEVPVRRRGLIYAITYTLTP